MVLRLLLVTMLAASLSLASSTARAQDAAPRRESPAWTWGLLGAGGVLVLTGLGTGIGALLVQSELDQVCSSTCPRSVASTQELGRGLAISTDVLWLTGVVVAGFGLVAALTLEEEVPAVVAACDANGCFASVGGRF